MLSASYFDASDPGRPSDPRNCFNHSSLNRTAPSWSLITTFTVSARSSGGFRIQGLTTWRNRVKQHVLPGRRYCPNPSHLHVVLGWDRAGEKKQRTRDLRWWQQNIRSGVGRRQLFVQKGDQPIRKVRNVDSSAFLGPQVSVLLASTVVQKC